MSTVLSLILMVILVAADQLTKLWAATTLKGTSGIGFIPEILHFVYGENTGAAFSLFTGFTGILSIISVAIVILGLVVVITRKPTKDKSFLIPVAVITAGGIGNLIDRVLKGYVVDFIYFKPINFPIFNLADIFVVCGIIFLFIYVFFIYKEPSKNPSEEILGESTTTKEL